MIILVHEVNLELLIQGFQAAFQRMNRQVELNIDIKSREEAA